MILEVDTHVEHQSSIVRGIKGIVADIGKTDVIGQVGEQDASHYAHIESGLPFSPIQSGVVRVHIGECRSDTESEVGRVAMSSATKPKITFFIIVIL